MIKKTTILGLTLSTLFFTACNVGSTSTPSITAIVEIDNTTTTKITQLYIKNSSSSSWGNDLLTGDSYIPGQRKVDFETYKCDRLIDIKVTGLLGSPVAIIEQVQLDCGSKFVYKVLAQ